MVYDREALAKPPSLSFSYTELEEIMEAVKGTSSIKKVTLEKLQIIKDFARTKAAYSMSKTTLTAR